MDSTRLEIEIAHAVRRSADNRKLFDMLGYLALAVRGLDRDAELVEVNSGAGDVQILVAAVPLDLDRPR